MMTYTYTIYRFAGETLAKGLTQAELDLALRDGYGDCQPDRIAVSRDQPADEWELRNSQGGINSYNQHQ